MISSRGIGSSENFEIIESLADKLGAAVGASRAAVDTGYIQMTIKGQAGKVVAQIFTYYRYFWSYSAFAE